jgi:hypothetical protein
MDLHVELVLPDRHRAVSLTVEAAAVSGHEDPPQAVGLVHRLVHDGDGRRVTLSLELTDPAAADLFDVLAEDLLAVVAKADDDRDGVGIWTGRMGRWQHLLRRAPHGLSAEYQRALQAELWVMREVLAPPLGVAAAVQAWQGPARARHDYQLPLTSLEVKSCAANQPQVVTINGERQLDDLGTPALHLAHISLDVHQNGPETLLEMVASLRNEISDSGADVLFEERLLDYGFLDAHAARYRSTGYTVREARFFKVKEGFPRLVEADLPEGIGGIQYRLTIAACVDFEVEREQIPGLGPK